MLSFAFKHFTNFVIDISYMGYSGESNFTLGRDQGMPEGFSKVRF